MAIQMVGIDYSTASLDIREQFSIQEKAAFAGMVKLKETYDLDGVLILSTCNRTELYISAGKERMDLWDMLCSFKGITCEKYKDLAVQRMGQEAVHHLFLLSCGMKSKVFGEDQIITQIKRALGNARDAGTADRYLEKVFQAAVTAAKKIKSQVRLTAVETSVVEQMEQVICNKIENLNGCKCLVIGNGEIGRLAAGCMVELGADVTVTVRSYRTRQVEIPNGCKVIDYADRYQYLQRFQMIISATASPHHTIKYEECAQLFRDGKHRYLFDLAVPRDISSKFREEPFVTVYDIDSLGGVSSSQQDSLAVKYAMDVIKEQEGKLISEKEAKEYADMIQVIGNIGAQLSYKRIQREVNCLVAKENQEALRQQICIGTKKTITSLLFDIKKIMDDAQWESCIKSISQVLTDQDIY